MSDAEYVMPLKSHAAWLPLLLAIPSASSAQGLAPLIQQQHVREWDAEESRLLQALDLANKAPGDQRLAIYRISLGLADLHEDRHQYAKAETNYESAHNVAKTLFGEQSQEAAICLNLLGMMRLKQGHIREADAVFRQAQKILDARTDSSPLQTAVLNNLAVIQQSTGNLSRAEGLIRKAIEMFEADPAANQLGFGEAVSNLALVLRDLGNEPEAMAQARRGVSILERCCEHSEALATSLVILSRFYQGRNDSASAEAYLQQALSGTDDVGEENNPVRALIFSHLGALYGLSGRKHEAETCFQRAIDINRRVLGPEHPRLLDSMEAYATFLRTNKRKAEAKRLEAYVREHEEQYHLNNPSIGKIVDAQSLMRQRTR